MGMALGPIPLTEINAYLAIADVADFDERIRYVRMIRSLDDVWLEHKSRKNTPPGQT